jgi:hypothetical protein
MRIFPILAAALPFLVAAGAPSTQPANTQPAYDPTLATPVYYEGQAIVVSTDAGTSIIRFNSTDDGNGKKGAHYHFRFLPVRGAEQRGEGEVYEHGRDSVTRIVAGKIAISWSFGYDDHGFIYFVPEDTTVRCLTVSDFETVDLSRFKK